MQSFKLHAAQGCSLGFSNSVVALPGDGGTIRISNLGPCPIAVLLGHEDAKVTQSTGLVIPSGQTEWLARTGGESHLVGVALGGPGNTSMVNVATGE